MPDTVRIVVPYDNEAGRRAYEVFADIALRMLYRAREAVTAWAADIAPDAEPIEEQAMNGGKYSMTFCLSNGDNMRVTYDYRTKEVTLD